MTERFDRRLRLVCLLAAVIRSAESVWFRAKVRKGFASKRQLPRETEVQPPAISQHPSNPARE
jgi:hypothetical protein